MRARPGPQDSYYYPGGNVGGPVRVPGTDFNKNNKLLFWAGYEYFKQNLGSATILQSYVPGADMRAGNFSLNNTNDTSALDSNAALCPGGFTAKATNWCNDLSGGYDANGNALQPGQKVPVDAGAKALMSLFPAANVNPLTNSGYNYYYAAGSQHNGWVWRGRVDYNLNDRNKFFVAYQEGRDSTTVPAHYVLESRQCCALSRWRTDESDYFAGADREHAQYHYSDDDQRICGRLGL